MVVTLKQDEIKKQIEELIELSISYEKMGKPTDSLSEKIEELKKKLENL